MFDPPDTLVEVVMSPPLRLLDVRPRRREIVFDRRFSSELTRKVPACDLAMNEIDPPKMEALGATVELEGQSTMLAPTRSARV